MSRFNIIVIVGSLSKAIHYIFIVILGHFVELNSGR